MTLQIEKLLNMKNKFFWLFSIFIGLSFIGCFTKHPYISNTSKYIKRNDTLGNLEIKELNLARESCPDGQLSFCFDGIKQSYRNFPAFVEIDSNGNVQFYDSFVYLLVSPQITDTLRKLNVKFSLPWDMDTLFNNVKDQGNSIKIAAPKFSKYVRNVNRKSKLQLIDFPGYFEYKLYNVNFACVYGGEQSIIIPNLNKFNNKADFVFKHCKIYYILDIKNIRPIKQKQEQ